MHNTPRRLPFGIPQDLFILSIGMMLWGLGEGLFIFFYPISLQRWNFNSVQIGAILSGLGVVMALIQAPAGYLADRFGTRPLIRVSLIVGVTAAGIMGAANTMPVFIIGLVGYTLTSFIGAPLNSYITAARGEWNAQRAMTFVSGAVQVGGILGPMLGGWIGEAAGLAMVFRISAGLFAAATIIIFFIRRPPAHEDLPYADNQPAQSIVSPRFIGLLAMIVLTIIAISMPQQLSSMYLQDIQHLSLQQIGLTGTFTGIGTAVILFVLGSIRAPLGMIVGQAALGIFSLLLWRGQSAAVFYCAYLFVGGYRLYRSMAMAVVRPMVSAGKVGLAYGLVETGNALAVIIAPLAAGLLYDYQPASVYIVSMAILAVTISLTWLLVARDKVNPF